MRIRSCRGSAVRAHSSPVSGPRPAWSTIILGAGPIGLTTALFAARRGKVLLVLPSRGGSIEPPRIDSVPVSLLALFLELGLHPAELGVECVHDTRLTAWESHRPVLSRCAATVHLERPRLERMLLKLVRLRGEIELRSDVSINELPHADLILDATGRRAVSARERFGGSMPRVCRTFVARGVFSKRQQVLRLACLPTGYAYRLGNRTTMTLGLVEDRLLEKGTSSSVLARLGELEAGWLVREFPLVDLKPGKGGAASVQWTDTGGSIIRIGDAAFARDALASQGISNGISSGLRILKLRDRRTGVLDRQLSEIFSHITRVTDLISTCRHRNSNSWWTYRRALLNSLRPLTQMQMFR